MTVPRSLSALAFLAAVGALATCRDATGPQGADLVDHVVVTGRTPLRIGEIVAFSARAYDSRDSVVAGLRFAWTTTDTAVATVDSGGVVRTLAPGEVTIAATVGRGSGVLRLTVTVRAVARIDVTPAIDSLFIGDSLQLTAVLYDSLGATLTDRAVIWRSSDSAKAVVSAAGLVRARSPGGFAATAESEGQRGGAFLTGQFPAVSLTLPDTVTLDAHHPTQVFPLVRSAGGVPLAGRAVAWSVADATVAVVSSGGVVTARQIGLTRLRAACCGELADSAVVRVVPQPVHWLWLSLSYWPVVVDSSVLVTAGPVDSLQWYVAVPVSWSSSDSTVLRVTPDSAGSRFARVTALGPGAAWVRASAGGRTDSIRVPTVLPVRHLRVEPDTVTARVGQWVRVFPTFRDSTGAICEASPAVSMLALDTSIAGVIWTWELAEVQGKRAGTTQVIVIADHAGVHYEDTVTVVVYRAGAPSLTWELPVASASTYEPLPAAVVLLDSAGAIPAAGSDVSVSISDTAVASVTPALLPGVRGRAVATIHPKRAGTAVLVARADSASAALWVYVRDAPITMLELTAPAVITAGDSVLLGVAENQRTGVLEYPLTWGTSDSAVAVALGTGYLVARAPGRVLVSVQSANLRDTATVVVRSASGLAIDSVRPGLLLAGGAATIAGSGFDPSPANNTVLVDGVPLVVTEASSGSLAVRLPPGTAFPCQRTHPALVTVASGVAMAASTAAFSAARQLSLSVGDTVRLTGPEAIRCNELAPSGTQYVITVASQNPSADATTAYQLRGTTDMPPVSGPAPGVPAARETGGLGARAAFLVVVPESSRDRALHRRILEESRRLAARAGPPAPLLRARPRIQASVADSVGPLVRFRVPRVDQPGFCANYWGVVARRAFHGRHIDIYEDVTGAWAGQMDSALAQVGSEFDGTMYPILLANFGDPLALDSLLDRSGRLTMLISPRVNDYATGFVVSCDFYPESVAPSSNTGETIYVIAPWERSGTTFSGSPAYWQWIIRSVLMHESKHVASFAQRLARGAPLEESWLEEGSAVIAEELWSRSVYQTAWRGNASYRATLYCDVRPREPECLGRPYAMFNAFALLQDYARPWSTGNETHTPLGPTSPTDGSFYGSAWSLLRWSIDQYASDEPSFLRALVDDPVRTGVANLEARAGRSLSALMADWLLASRWDDRTEAGPLASPLYAHPSWNFTDIFAGMAADFPQDFGAFPFGRRATSWGTFTFEVPVLRGGAVSLFEIWGQQVKQLLEVRGPGGGPPPSGLELRILRSQ